jgi:tetratricopeptide (TPR) repeat protein
VQHARVVQNEVLGPALSDTSGADEETILVVQGNIATIYAKLGRFEEATRIKREVYSGYLKLNGEEDEKTLLAANNYAGSLLRLERFKETKKLLRKTVPVARRVLGDSNDTTLRMRANYNVALVNANCSTLDDIREAVETLEEIVRTTRRVLGGSHPVTEDIGRCVRHSRAVLHARETPPPEGSA